MRNTSAGFTSTTTKKEVAISYLRGKKMAVLFKIETGDIDRGCTLSWVSQYPSEDELLMPAMSYLEITGKPTVEETPKGSGFLVTVYPARINCNTKSQVALVPSTTPCHCGLSSRLPVALVPSTTPCHLVAYSSVLFLFMS
jgi:hypothetical protein